MRFAFPVFIPLVAALLFASRLPGADAWVRAGDVIAFVGGEDMVVASETGVVEAHLIRALPAQRLRFRNLAWEGDTVFEQHRDLNFPPLDAQLEKVGATLVIAQFGKMESFGGEAGIEPFREHLEALVARLGAGGKRRTVLVAPWSFENDDGSGAPARGASNRRQNVRAYASVVRSVAERNGCLFCAVDELAANDAKSAGGFPDQFDVARAIAKTLRVPVAATPDLPPADALRDLIRAKNRLWFHYWRPQNWAFLNGDRTSQPSSRDHLDPSKRWFPAEIEQFVPLIEAKEREIDALALKLTK